MAVVSAWVCSFQPSLEEFSKILVLFPRAEITVRIRFQPSLEEFSKIQYYILFKASTSGTVFNPLLRNSLRFTRRIC